MQNARRNVPGEGLSGFLLFAKRGEIRKTGGKPPLLVFGEAEKWRARTLATSSI